jgi:hypothetical protein
MIDAHCRAYDTIHRTYEERGWGNPMVSYNAINFSIYHLDKLTTDLLLARRNGVSRADLPSYIADSKRAFDATISGIRPVAKESFVGRRAEKTLDRFLALCLTPERLATGVDAIYSSPFDEKLDYVAIDYYDPFVRHLPKWLSIQDLREGRFHLYQELWEQVLNPRGLYDFIKAETSNAEGIPVIVLESGMCYREYKGRVEARHDGATRDKFLQSYIYEVLRAVKDGLPVKGYFHWTMVDNYEWGSYEPRFGLFTVDRTRSPVKTSSVDAWGVNAAAVYAELIASLRDADRERRVAAFSRDDW